MRDIAEKIYTYREAVAQAIVHVSNEETIKRIKENTVPKGNVFEMSKASGLLAVKQTPYMLPDCHPIPIEATTVEYEIEGLSIIIKMTVKTIYKTGVEVEAMHGVANIALCMYDMLKPIDKGIEISTVKLLNKKGGKSDYIDKFRKDLTASVIVCSDTISAGQKEDKAGKAIVEKLKKVNVEVNFYGIIPDEPVEITNTLQNRLENSDIIIFCGGTGLSSRDVTYETLKPLLEREIPGIEEAIRSYGQQRTPFAMLSRTVAGTIGKHLILGLPGSTRGAKESMDAVFPHVLHVFRILNNKPHQK
jgi:molybdenum cofactor biosynthesis protein MoaC